MILGIDAGGLLGSIDRESANYIAFDTAKSRRIKRPRVYSKKTVDEITSVLVDVVESDRGTGNLARLDSGLPVAGKTGTAQIPNPRGRGYLKGQYLATFAGFFPADAPRYVVLVMFKNPRGKYYGGQVAAPVFKRVSDRICYLDRIAPAPGMVASESSRSY